MFEDGMIISVADRTEIHDCLTLLQKAGYRWASGMLPLNWNPKPNGGICLHCCSPQVLKYSSGILRPDAIPFSELDKQTKIHISLEDLI